MSKAMCSRCHYLATDCELLESDTIRIEDGYETVKQGKKEIRVPIWHFHKFKRIRDKEGEVIYFHCPSCLMDCIQCKKKLALNRAKTFDVSRHVNVTK